MEELDQALRYLGLPFAVDAAGPSRLPGAGSPNRLRGAAAAGRGPVRGHFGRVLLEQAADDLADAPAFRRRARHGSIVQRLRYANGDPWRMLPHGRAEGWTAWPWPPAREIEACLGPRRQPVQFGIRHDASALPCHRHSITLA
jgi:hypothetical protein